MATPEHKRCGAASGRFDRRERKIARDEDVIRGVTMRVVTMRVVTMRVVTMRVVTMRVVTMRVVTMRVVTMRVVTMRVTPTCGWSDRSATRRSDNMNPC
ncbi:MAG TPA: hypothetical protein VGG30_03480 [Pirellulales bacterium]